MSHLPFCRRVSSVFLATLFLTPALTIAPAQSDESSQEPYQVADNNNLPTRIPGLGTYSGGISARQFKGNGIYFSVNGNNYCCLRPDEKKGTPRSGAKIIDMENAEHAMDCDNPGDVCIMRPGVE